MRFLHNFLTGSTVAGVEIQLNGLQTVYRCVLLKRVGNKIKTEKVSDEIHSTADLAAFCPAHIPAVVVVTGKGVIFRILSDVSETDRGSLLHKVLPDVNESDFFSSIVPLTERSYLISMVRKDALTGQLAALDQYISIIQGFIGPGIVLDLPLFSETTHETQVGNYVLVRNNGTLTSVKNTAAPAMNSIDMSGEMVPTRVLLAFGAAVNAIVYGLEEIRGGVEILPDAAARYFQKRSLQLTLKLTLVGLLLVLSINYLFFSHYRAALVDMESDVSGYRTTIAVLNQKEKEIARKKLFLQETGLHERTYWSWYTDRLVHEMPAGIRLEKLELSPMIALQRDDTVAFDRGLVRIYGFGSEHAVVNAWLKKLEHTVWVRSVKLQSYGNTSAEHSGAFYLELALQ